LTYLDNTNIIGTKSLIESGACGIHNSSPGTIAEAKFTRSALTKDIDVKDLGWWSIDFWQDLGGLRRLWDCDLSDSLVNNLGLLGCVADGDLFNLVIILSLTLPRGSDLLYR
jgi:hypothetical protein